MLLYNPANVLDKAVIGLQKQIGAGTIPAPRWMSRGSSRFLSWFQTRPQVWRALGTHEPDYLSTLDNPRTLRYQQSNRGELIHPSSQGPFAPWQVEIARFSVPYGSVGFINQWKQFAANAENGDVWTGFDNFGDPFIAPAFRWVLRLDTFDGRSPLWINSLLPVHYPGIPFPDLPEETGLWFKCDSGVPPFRWTIPGGYQLRLFFESPESQEAVRFRIAAKLSGLIQTAYSCEAATNERRLW